MLQHLITSNFLKTKRSLRYMSRIWFRANGDGAVVQGNTKSAQKPRTTNKSCRKSKHKKKKRT